MATSVEEKTEVETIINAEEKKPKKECRRCSGYGRIDAYTHIKGGVCFSCNGSGKK
jgi:DnaJ-class molecular chaperone